MQDTTSAAVTDRTAPGRTFAVACRRIGSRISRDFVALVAIVGIWNAATILDPLRRSAHDTFCSFLVFHTFQSHLAIEGTLPLWCPYVTFGMPGLFFQLGLSPSGSGFAAASAVLGLKDAHLLFKASVFHELLVLLSGLHFLARRLFDDRRVRFLVCLIGVGVFSWNYQLYFNFRIAAYGPWMIWCVLKWSDTGRGAWFWRTGIVACASLIGTPIYFAGLHLMTLSFAALPLVLRRPALLLAPFRIDRGNLIGAGLFGIVAAIVALSNIQGYEGLQVIAPARRADGRVDLQTFLSYAEIDDQKIYMSYILGVVSEQSPEPTTYAGIATWLFCLGALPGRRRPELAVVVLPAIALWLLAMSPAAASVMYRFPFMSFFRHRMHTLSLANLFFLLWAGFGIERLVAADPRARRRWMQAATLCLSALLFAAGWHWRWGSSPDRMHVFLRIGALLAVAAWTTVGSFRSAGLQIGVLTSWFLLDMSLYQQDLGRVARIVDARHAGLFRTRPLGYVPDRRRQQLGLILDLELGEATHSLQYQWERRDSGLDECIRLAVPARLKNDVSDAFMNPRNEDVFAAIAGYSRSKLRFTNSAVGVAAWDEAHQILAEHRGQVATLSSKNAPKTIVADEARREFDVLPSEFTANRLRCQIDAPVDGWVIYADCMFDGWHATVDGAPADLLLANGCFKAVAVPVGSHEVVFEIGGRAKLWSYLQFSLALVVFVTWTCLIASAFGRHVVDRWSHPTDDTASP